MTTAPDDLTAALDRLAQLQDRNRARLDALAQRGALVDPMMLAKMRVDALVELLIPADPEHPTRVVFEGHYEDRLAAFLDHVEEQLTRQRLHLPPQARG